MAQQDDITLKMVLDHMQNMQRVLMTEIQGVEKRLTNRIDGLEKRIDGLESTVKRNHNLLVRQIDAIDKRLDEVEIEKLPKRVRKLEVAVGIA